MTGMTMTAESVAAASAAWVWVPDNATVVETDEYTILRMPDYFEYKLSVNAFARPARSARRCDRVLDRARSFGLPEVRWPVPARGPGRARRRARGARRARRSLVA